MTVPTRRTRERGSATVLAAAMVAVLAVCLVGAGGLLSAVVASHRARAAADMSALAAAGALLNPTRAPRDPCDVAAEIADRNGGRVRSCVVRGDTVTLKVVVPPSVSVLGPAIARARAGPAAASPFAG